MRVRVLERTDETLVLSVLPIEELTRPKSTGDYDLLGVIDIDPSRLSPVVSRALHSVGHHIVVGADSVLVREALVPPLPPPPPREFPRWLG